jgi:hypothetical protein
VFTQLETAEASTIRGYFKNRYLVIKCYYDINTQDINSKKIYLASELEGWNLSYS